MADPVDADRRSALRPAKPRQRAAKKTAGAREPANLEQLRSMIETTLAALGELQAGLAKQQAVLDDIARSLARADEAAEAQRPTVSEASVTDRPPPSRFARLLRGRT